VNRVPEVLRQDEWSLTNDAILFDKTNTAVNGQHRLPAIAEARKWLITGDSAEARTTSCSPKTFVGCERPSSAGA